mmetsp:Transcript_82260/g.228967  ORF Transcript_82260/g.228967 Transcript_82260/m.228967 type:complete len:160 (-) Transcript_82260:348-827(-)
MVAGAVRKDSASPTAAVPPAGVLFASLADVGGPEITGTINPELLAKAPWVAQMPEGTAPNGTFVCYARQVFGVQVPGKAGGNSSFHYVRPHGAPGDFGVECYEDMNDSTFQFIIMPPIKDYSSQWRMLFRRYVGGLENDGFGHERVLVIGHKHPCVGSQ